MIIHLDSNFRNYEEYPYSSEFILPINNKPSDVKRLSDVRSTNLTRDYLRFYYKWIGNSSFNNPISKIKNDTLIIKYIPISPNKCIYISESSTNNYTKRDDYFIGTIFWSELTNLSASIINYDAYVMSMDADIFDIYFENICLYDVQSPNVSTKIFELEGYVINPSIHQKSNLVILGSPSYVSSVQNQGVLKGINKNQIIENVTKNWSRKIKKVENNRNIILEEVPSYDSNDFFIVWDSDYKKKYELINEPFLNGVRDFEIIESDSGFKNGDIVKYNDLTMEVLEVNNEGVIKILKIVYPGNDILEKDITLTDETREVKINISLIGSGIILNVNEFIDINNYMISVVSIEQNEVFYYSIFEKKDNIIYLDINDIQLNTIKKNYIIPNNVYSYFIYFESVLPNLNAPIIPYQNLVCTEMKIISISLPNLPVCGYNIRLADFPYLLLSVCNSNGQSCEIKQNLISNIQTSQKSNFLLPIANVRNPELNFVTLTTRQKAFFKFSPRDSLLFRIFLPNGQLLKFNAFERTEFFRFNCQPLSLPLNSYLSIIGSNEAPTKTNSKLVYPYVMEHGISIVLEFNFLI